MQEHNAETILPVFTVGLLHALDCRKGDLNFTCKLDPELKDLYSKGWDLGKEILSQMSNEIMGEIAYSSMELANRLTEKVANELLGNAE